MILILGDKSDYCLNMVLDWLSFFKVEYFLLNSNSSISIKDLRVEDGGFEFYVNNELINLRKVSAVFNWRGHLNSIIVQALLSDKVFS